MIPPNIDTKAFDEPQSNHANAGKQLHLTIKAIRCYGASVRTTTSIVTTLISMLILHDFLRSPMNRLDETSIIKSKDLQHTSLVAFASAHIVLTKDDRGQSLVLTGEDGKGGGNDQLVIAGHNMGGNGAEGEQNSNMIVQDAANREGDVVMSGNSMVIPGEDGHIVLADGRSKRADHSPSPMSHMPNMLALWFPYMRGGLRTPYSFYDFNILG